jgi:hypothetical protein
VNASKAPSTQKYDNETIEKLTAKCEEHSCGWAPVAQALNSASAEELVQRASKINGNVVEKTKSNVKV